MAHPGPNPDKGNPQRWCFSCRCKRSPGLTPHVDSCDCVSPIAQFLLQSGIERRFSFRFRFSSPYATACLGQYRRNHQHTALLTLCEGNLLGTGASPHKWQVMRSASPCHYIMITCPQSLCYLFDKQPAMTVWTHPRTLYVRMCFLLMTLVLVHDSIQFYVHIVYYRFTSSN